VIGLPLEYFEEQLHLFGGGCADYFPNFPDTALEFFHVFYFLLLVDVILDFP